MGGERAVYPRTGSARTFVSATDVGAQRCGWLCDEKTYRACAPACCIAALSTANQCRCVTCMPEACLVDPPARESLPTSPFHRPAYCHGAPMARLFDKRVALAKGFPVELCLRSVHCRAAQDCLIKCRQGIHIYLRKSAARTAETA